MATVRIEIRSRWDAERVLYAADVDESVPSGLRLRAALEKATRERADLRGAYLRGADLSGAYLRDAYLSGADLSGAYLRGAYLGGDKANPRLKLVGRRPILSIGPIGSRDDYLLAYVTDEGVYVRAGCFFDTLDAFRSAVSQTHGDSEHGREYAAAIAMIEAHAAIWTPTVEQAEAA